eukprot:scaffold38243_cov75-Cyclotella_meneghiniana.AAC.1
MKSGISTARRRRNRFAYERAVQAANKAGKPPPPPPPKRQRGRPPKNKNPADTQGQKKAAPDTEISRHDSSSSSSTTPATNRRRVTPSAPARRITRSNAPVSLRPRDTIPSKETFVAKPATPIRKHGLPKEYWRTKEYQANAMMKVLATGREAYKSMWQNTIADYHIERMKRLEVNAQELPCDRSLTVIIPTVNPSETKLDKLVREFMTNHPLHPAVQSIKSIVGDIHGLKKVKNVPMNTRICNLNEAMRAIVSHYLSSSSNSDQADIVASLLFNGNIFQDNSIAK